MTPTKRLATLVERMSSRNIPAKVLTHAKVCLLDWLGCAIAGCAEPAGRMARELTIDMGGKGRSTVIGTTVRTSCPGAALVNGIYGHCIELDDIHEESIIHPAAPVMPAALAISEKEGVSGKDLLTSIVTGYETEIRIASAVMPSHYKYWHTTGTYGTFGATAAVGKLLSLDMNGLVRAFGIAGTQAAGLIEAFGTMSKPLNAGKAAMNGVLSGLLAERGFTSSDSILEASKGYCRATSDQFDPKYVLTENKTFEITRNVFKRHSCCGHMHGALDGVIAIMNEKQIQLKDIRNVRVRTYPIAVEVVGRSVPPTSVSEARFNLPFCLALALVRGRVGPLEFNEKNLHDPEVSELSARVQIEADPELSNARLGSAKVEIELVSGRRIRKQVDHPKGHHANPLSRQELEEKFENLASTALEEREVRSLIQTVRDLENLRHLDGLLALLRGEK